MTAFSLRGSTALVALSVSLTIAVPFTAVGQSSPEVTAPEAPIPEIVAPQVAEPAIAAPAAPAAPAAEAPWQTVTRLGLRFEVPPGAVLPDAAEGLREAAVSTIGANGVGARMGIRLLDTAERESMPAPDAPEMAAFLSDLSGVPVTATGVEMTLGTWRLIAYGGSGAIPASGGGTLDARMLYLISAEPDANGQALMVAVFSAGLGDGVAAELEAHFIGSLAPADDMPGAEAEEPEAATATAPEPPAASAEADPTAPLLAAVEAMPLPARVTPEGWERHSAFGLSVAAPAEAEMTDRSNRRNPEVSFRLRPDGSGTELRIALAAMSAEELSALGIAPGTPGFLEMIAQGAGIPTAESPRRILVGDRGMVIYVGMGLRERQPNRGEYEHTLSLIAEEPDAEGNYAVVGATARGYAPDEAETLVNQVIASVAPEIVEAAPATTETPPETGPATEDATDDTTSGFDAIAAALPAPSGTMPEGWDAVEAMGVRMAVPPGLDVEADPEGRGLDIGGRDEAARTEIEMGGVLAAPDRLAPFDGPPGSPRFAEGLARWARVEVRDSGRELPLGGRSMRLYIASGEQEETPQLGGRVTGFYLVSMQPDAAGDTLILGGAFRGYAEADAVALIGQIVASLGDAAPSAAPVAVAVAETPILPGFAAIRLPAGVTVLQEDRNERSADLFLGEAGAPPQTRLNAGRLMGRPLERQLDRMLHEVDALTEAEIGGMPVWVIHGTATHSLEDRPADAAARIPAQLVVPQLCEEGAPVYLLGILGAPGDEARIDAMLPQLVLQRPEGAGECPPSVMDGVRAMIAADTGTSGTGAAPITLPQSPAVPEGWARHSRFGLTFAAPAEMEMRRERLLADRMEYWLQARDGAGEVSEEISLRIFTPTSLGDMPLQTPDQPGFAAMLSGFGEITVAESGERMVLGDVTLRAFRGDSNIDGRLVRLLYLIAEAPSANGLSPWLVVRSAGQTSDAALGFERDVLASLSGSPEIPPQTEEPAPDRTPPTAEPPRTQSPVASTASPEAQAFQAARTDGSTEALLAYLAAYPRGLHSGDARTMLRERGIVPPDERRPIAPVTDPEAMDWQRALDEARMEGFWTYLKMWPQGLHADEARARLDQLRPPAPVPYAPSPRPMK
ncbi:hypothetical protein [Pararhodobacter aggregans]|uniref:Uncharacterized protein n=1 Tax=Pararhodobacter aggregans TaxID=404875 RepID=A0A2T7UTE4_9RHOB|nr:hypothetical protein [Pararhodobacter aggregans]PTX02700.1 hypothetical protein C8N33_10460 [Pararhodobacter aggregans]PVE47932.1 hypothetical protein DDE23_07245 [Pararhodobacter aggregans]